RGSAAHHSARIFRCAESGRSQPMAAFRRDRADHGRSSCKSRIALNNFAWPVAKWILAAICALAATSARADPVADFYSGRSMPLLIGFGPGGGYDTYARALARHLGKHIPGQPMILPQNMPGAGGLAAANYLYNVAPADGSTLAMLAPFNALEPLFGNPSARF